jgi:hypothetical protein
MSNFNRKDVQKMSIKELEDYIQRNSLNVQNNSNTNQNNRKNENNNKNDENILFNFLNYNYLDNKNNQLPDKDLFDNKEEAIYKLLKENSELKFDIKKVLFFTERNENDLVMKIKELSEENINLKQEIHELKNKLILQTNILTNTEVDKHQIINEKQIMKEKYDNEIKELNCQLNNYKAKLNYLNLEYQNLLENFHKFKQESIIHENRRRNPYLTNSYEEKKQSSIDESVNINKILNKNNININNNINKPEKELFEKKISNEKDKIIKIEGKHNLSQSKSNNSKLLKRSKTFNQKNNVKRPNSNIKKKNFNTNKGIKKSSKKNIANSNKNNYLLTSDLNNNSNRFVTSYNNSNSKNINQFIEEEIFSLERKLAELNISYQSFLQKLKQIPNSNYKESNELKETLKYLQETIDDKNKKLNELKIKQQQFLIQSTMEIN